MILIITTLFGQYFIILMINFVYGAILLVFTLIIIPLSLVRKTSGE